MQNLTPRQLRAFEFIKSHTERVGYAPTLRELCDYMGYKAVGSAQDVIASLRRKGYVTTPLKQAARSLILSEKGRALFSNPELDSAPLNEALAIPCVGAVAAGKPLEAIENHEGSLQMSLRFLPRSVQQDSLFAVRAKGESMIHAGILDGDWLIVQKQQDAAIGAIVVAQVEDDATVKRLGFDSRRGYFLKPENPAFDVMYADRSPFAILGKVLALQRTFNPL